jgi:hypothetical protein
MKGRLVGELLNMCLDVGTKVVSVFVLGDGPAHLAQQAKAILEVASLAELRPRRLLSGVRSLQAGRNKG